MRIFLAILAFLGSTGINAQYYLRGEIRDENNSPLSNAKIILHSSRYVYFSGNSGAFGITSTIPKDSITIVLDGYVNQCEELQSARYHTIRLKLLPTSASVKKKGLLSFTKDLKFEDRPKRLLTGETYSTLLENDFIPALKYPETGFAIHTDKASYSNIRRFLHTNTTVPRDAVRVEEMLNYFDFNIPPPKRDSIFGLESIVSECPWNPENQLVYLQIAAKKIESENIPPSNLVFLIDVSGSMDMPNRLPLLKASFKLLVDNLREQDTVSIVVYGSSTGVFLTPTSGKEKDKIRKAIEDLHPGGATPGVSGILNAYRLAQSQYITGGNNRVILATDGDFNIGQSSEDDLEKLITRHQQLGIYLTCLGVGMGNYKDSKLEILAKKGNGNFAYLDSEQEAEKILVKEFTQTVYTVADDVYLNVAFNPDLVKEYRLIGFDNKMKAITDTLSNIEGGEVGSGHSMMVLFEITPVIRNNTFANDVIADITVHYRLPMDSANRTTTYAVPNNFFLFKELPPTYRFASAVALFGSLLKESKFVGRSAWNDAIILAHDSYDPKSPLQKEFVALIEKARKVYSKKRRQ